MDYPVFVSRRESFGELGSDRENFLDRQRLR